MVPRTRTRRMAGKILLPLFPVLAVTLARGAPGVKPPEWTARFDGKMHADDSASAQAIDPAGNVLVTGTDGLDRNLTVKYAPDGQRLWRVENEALQYSGAVAADAAGNVYLAGGSNRDGARSISVAKYDPHGNLLWITHPEGEGAAQDLSLDRDGNAYVLGVRGRRL